MGNHTLGIAGGARRVVQGNRVPFVMWQLPVKFRATPCNKVFVVNFANGVARRCFVVFDFNHKRALIGQHGECFLDHTRKLTVNQQYFCLAVLQHESNGFCIKTGVECVQHGPSHRHAEVHLQHGRHVRQHRRHRIAFANAAGCQCVCQLAAAGVGLAPGLATLAVDGGQTVRVHLGRSLNEAQWRKGYEIGGILVQS